MGKNFLKIYDTVQFSLLTSDPDNIPSAVKDGLFIPGSSEANQGLLVRIAASHSGKITRNNGYYLPEKMRRGAESFIENYGKPVLIHHKDHEDAIGRVIQSRYVDISGAMRDRFEGKILKDSKGKGVKEVTSTLFDQFLEGAMPFAHQVDFVRGLAKDSLLEEDSYEGLGYIEIVARVTDPNAIQKLLDGRYMTGSVGATTDRAVCSVCKQDWTEEGRCEHTPGDLYDSAKCFLIAGSLVYDEYSFVNVPADRHSKVLELHYNGISDSIEITENNSGKVYESQIDFVTEEEVKMAGKKIEDSVDAGTPVDNKVEDQESGTPVVDPTAEPSSEEPEGGTVEDSAEAGSENGKPEGEEEGIENIDDSATNDPLEELITKALSDDTTLTNEEEVQLYDALWDELILADLAELKGTRLTDEARAKLPKSVFCGPNRTFPVTDTFHVAAIRRLLDRYEGPGNKDSVLVGVDRKAKAMGFSGLVKEDATEPENTNEVEDSSASRLMHSTLSLFEEDSYADDKSKLTEEEKTLLRTLLKRLSSLVGKDNFIAAVVAEDLALDPSFEEALVAEIQKFETMLGDQRDSHSALRKEYDLLYRDMEVVQDQLVAEKLNSRKVKGSFYRTLISLKDGIVADKETPLDLSDEVIDSELTRLTKEVDMVKIADKLGDGMSRKPEGTVEDPTAIEDDEDQERITVEPTPQMKIQENLKALEAIQAKYLELRLSRGEGAAENYKRNALKRFNVSE